MKKEDHMLQSTKRSFYTKQYYYNWFLKKNQIFEEYHIMILKEPRNASVISLTKQPVSM